MRLFDDVARQNGVKRFLGFPGRNFSDNVFFLAHSPFKKHGASPQFAPFRTSQRLRRLAERAGSRHGRPRPAHRSVDASGRWGQTLGDECARSASRDGRGDGERAGCVPAPRGTSSQRHHSLRDASAPRVSFGPRPALPPPVSQERDVRLRVRGSQAPPPRGDGLRGASQGRQPRVLSQGDCVALALAQTVSLVIRVCRRPHKRVTQIMLRCAVTYECNAMRAFKKKNCNGCMQQSE